MLSSTTIQSASPAAITVLCAGAMSMIIRELASAFEQATGERISAEFTRSGVVKDRVEDGETVDVVITTKAAMDDLVGRMMIVPDSAAVVARSGIGIAIRAGAAKPDISSVASFKHTLRDAKSIAYADPSSGSPSGRYLVQLFDRLGMSAQLKSKTRLIGAAGDHVVVVCETVAKGEAEIGIQQISEIIPVAGVELVGPLPSELQHMTIFSAAVGAGARNADSARRFVEFITSAAAAPVIKAKGMEEA